MPSPAAAASAAAPPAPPDAPSPPPPAGGGSRPPVRSGGRGTGRGRGRSGRGAGPNQRPARTPLVIRAAQQSFVNSVANASARRALRRSVFILGRAWSQYRDRARKRAQNRDGEDGEEEGGDEDGYVLPPDPALPQPMVVDAPALGRAEPPVVDDGADLPPPPSYFESVSRRRPLPDHAVPMASSRSVAVAAASAARNRHVLQDWERNCTPEEMVVPPASTTAEHLENVSRHVWGVEKLRPQQLQALLQVCKPEAERKLLNIARTGAGKTHFLLVLGTFVRGIILIDHPLLALTADQVLRFQEGTDRFGVIDAINGDNCTPEMIGKIVGFLDGLKKSTNRTLFLFLSPQKLAGTPSLLAALKRCAEARTLRVVAVDEAHLIFTHASFRPEVRKLGEEFFRPLFHTTGWTPIAIAMTATMSQRNLRVYSKITHVVFKQDSRYWPDADDFTQPYIQMSQRVTSSYTSELDFVVDKLMDSSKDVTFVFVNSKSRSFKLVKSLEDKLDLVYIADDVTHLNGSLRKEEKFALVNIVTGKVKVPEVNPRSMVATSAADLGIDHSDCSAVLIIEWPDSISVYIQRRGRGSRDGRPSETQLAAGIASYIGLVKRILAADDRPADEIDSNDKTAAIKLSSSINLPAPQDSPYVKAMREQYTLMSAKRKQIVQCQLLDLLEVLQLFCMNAGCQHLRLQQWMAHGELRDDLVGGACSCATQCPICSGFWKTRFLPVRKEAVQMWLRKVDGNGDGSGLPAEATCANLYDLIWNNIPLKRGVFDRKKVAKYNVEALFLQLIALDTLGIEKRKDDKVYWVLLGKKEGTFVQSRNYECDSRWKKAATFPQDHSYKYDFTDI